MRFMLCCSVVFIDEVQKGYFPALTARRHHEHLKTCFSAEHCLQACGMLMQEYRSGLVQK